MKFTIEVTSFKRLDKGALVGFCDIKIRELRIKVHEVAVYAKNGSRWASMPAKPWFKDGVAVRGDSGKIQYTPLFEFETKVVRDAFGAAVWRALLDFDPNAAGAP